jgi:hypothetical protein
MPIHAWPFLVGVMLSPATDTTGGSPVGGSGPAQYCFVRDLDRPVALFRGDSIVEGRLDAAGNFLEDPSKPIQHLGKPYSGPNVVEINGREAVGDPVYEFRSGRLIRGSFAKSRTFVPDLGSTVINFKDYRYRPGGIRIYNLPGRFVKIEEDTPQDQSRPVNRKDERQPGKPR